jgi:hypothetical protein
MAVEYTFWDERLPEILICCGQPIKVNNGRRQSTKEWDGQLCAALAATQDELAAFAKLRDPANFETILAGRLGISGVYGGWKRLLALLTGRVYQPSHRSIPRQ